MRSLVVLSGKGGTGKTTVVGSFAALSERPVLADCDVDAANLHLLLSPEVREAQDFTASKRPVINPGCCTGCEVCVENCAFGALKLDADGVAEVDPYACEGCGLCARLCAASAIEMEPTVSGRWFVSDTRYGPLVHARLRPAEENSGRLVTVVRQRAAEIAEARAAPWLIVDGAPGIGCPVIASLAGAKSVLIVTEPTVAGRSDLRRVAQLVRHFDLSVLVCVNKWDLHGALTAEIEAECRDRGYALVGRVPYDDAVPRSIADGVPLVEWDDGPASQATRSVWAQVAEMA
jgi:MinD superfamily P-loop ATPase